MNIFLNCLTVTIGCFEYFAKCLGYFLIAFVFFAISFLYTSGTFFIFPFMLKNSLLLFLSRLILFLSTSNLIYNYFLCLNIGPGFANSNVNSNILVLDELELDLEQNEQEIKVESDLEQESEIEKFFNFSNSHSYDLSNQRVLRDGIDDNLNSKEINLFIGGGPEIEIKECNKCGALRYPRTHHCSICKKCVLNMDHHCPWIGQCVGLHNRKYFILFLGWSFLSCLQISIFSIPMMIILLNTLFGNSNTTANYLILDNLTFQGLLLSAMLSISFTLGTGALLFFHIYLLITNQSTIEYHRNTIFKKYFEKKGQKWVNCYDRGISNNIKEVMGTTKFPLIMFSCFYK